MSIESRLPTPTLDTNPTLSSSPQSSNPNQEFLIPTEPPPVNIIQSAISNLNPLFEQPHMRPIFDPKLHEDAMGLIGQVFDFFIKANDPSREPGQQERDIPLGRRRFDGFVRDGNAWRIILTETEARKRLDGRGVEEPMSFPFAVHDIKIVTPKQILH